MTESGASVSSASTSSVSSVSASTIPARPPRARRTRRGGYVGAIVVNAIMLYLINVWPGWAVLPFLTDDLRVVLPWINASILTSIVVNVGYLVADPRWVRALGSIVTGVVGLVATVRMWQVFPFDFAGSAID
ncbi:MAG TPA: hypothetical protein VIU11_21420, partial [Nakamurella sp.]